MLNGSMTVGTFDFRNPVSRTITGSLSHLEFDVSSGSTLLQVQTSDLSIQSAVSLADTTEMQINFSTSVNLVGVVEGSGGLTTNWSAGLLLLHAANTYGGALQYFARNASPLQTLNAYP